VGGGGGGVGGRGGGGGGWGGRGVGGGGMMDLFPDVNGSQPSCDSLSNLRCIYSFFFVCVGGELI